MAIQEVTPVQANSKGGSGVLGSIVGTLAGGGAGFLIGGPVGAAVGAGLGGSIGGTSGTLIDPAQSGGSDAPVPEIQSSRMGAMGKAPEVQMAGMQNAKNLLATSDVPNAQDYMSMIDQAQGQMKQRLGQNSFLKA